MPDRFAMSSYISARDSLVLSIFGSHRSGDRHSPCRRMPELRHGYLQLTPDFRSNLSIGIFRLIRELILRKTYAQINSDEHDTATLNGLIEGQNEFALNSSQSVRLRTIYSNFRKFEIFLKYSRSRNS